MGRIQRILKNLPSDLYKHLRYFNTPFLKFHRLKRLLGQRHTHRKKILLIDQAIPAPDKDSGSFRMMQVLSILSRSHDVVFWPDSINGSSRYLVPLERMGIEVEAPFSPERFLAEFGHYLDAVILSRPEIMHKHLNRIRTLCPQAKVVYDTVDLHFIRMRRESEITADPIKKAALNEQAYTYHKIEADGIMKADQTWVISETEKELVRKQAPHSNVHVIPNIHPLPDIREKSFHGTEDILFLGSFGHSPNIDSILYFTKEIWPLITPEIPEAHLVVIGPHASKEVIDLATDKIVIRGYVPDLEQDLLKARVFIAPLRFGAGMKGKVGQALSFGIPTVTTAIGAEGFGFRGDELIIEDDPEGFARGVISLYTDKAIWEKYHKNGRAFMDRFTPSVVGKTIIHAIDDICGIPGGPGRADVSSAG